MAYVLFPLKRFAQNLGDKNPRADFFPNSATQTFS